MSTEQKVEGQQTPGEQTPGTEGEQEAQYTPIQLKAIEQGWIPKEEYDGDEDGFIDAPEFVRRGELFSKISSQTKKIQQVEQALVALREHNTKIKQAEYNRALATLKAAHRKAVVEGEHEQAFILEDKLDEVKAEKEAIEAEHAEMQQTDNGPTPEFAAWKDKNPWYDTNEVMQSAADAIGRKLHKQGYSASEVLKEVTKQIKEEFPHKFRSQSTNKPNAVEGASRTPGKRGDDNLVMTEQEKDMMKKIVKTGVMTEAEYKTQLKATR